MEDVSATKSLAKGAFLNWDVLPAVHIDATTIHEEEDIHDISTLGLFVVLKNSGGAISAVAQHTAFSRREEDTQMGRACRVWWQRPPFPLYMPISPPVLHG